MSIILLISALTTGFSFGYYMNEKKHRKKKVEKINTKDSDDERYDIVDPM